MKVIYNFHVSAKDLGFWTQPLDSLEKHWINLGQ